MLKITRKSRLNLLAALAAGLTKLVVAADTGGPLMAAEEPAQVASPAEQTIAAADANLLRETWDVVTIAGEQVGYRNFRSTIDERSADAVRPENTGAQRIVVHTAVDFLRISRGGTPFETLVRTTSRQRSDGTVVSFECQARIGAMAEKLPAQRTRGNVTEGRIRWQKSTGDDGAVEKSSSPWPPGAGGYFALEQSLLSKPLTAGERRSVQALTPMLDSFDTTELVARDWQPTELLDETRRLLRIEAKTNLPGGVQTAMTIWCNAEGEMLKSSQPAIGLVAYRADRRRALQPLAPTADLFQELIVKVDPPLAKPHERDHATYDVQLASGAPAEVFAADYRQQWQPLGNKRARLQATATWADDWKERTTTTGATPPADALTANKLIDCHHPRVVELANSVAHDETDAWQTAQQLERLVNDAITEKNLESAFAAASTVATDRAGDCTEHAVLLAALCRARDIPARVAVGLVYVDSLDGFLYHMWNEVWIDGQWRPLDATFGRGGVGATHLKISDSLLDEDNAYASMLPVVNVIGQVKIREVGGQSSEVREIPE